MKGLTLSADWWHIDMRDIVVEPRRAVHYQQLYRPSSGPGATRADSIPGPLGPINLVIDPNENLSGAIFEGLDYEAIYILDSTIFGGSDLGRVTTTINGTWLSQAVLQPNPDANRLVLQVSSYRPRLA